MPEYEHEARSVGVVRVNSRDPGYDDMPPPRPKSGRGRRGSDSSSFCWQGGGRCGVGRGWVRVGPGCSGPSAYEGVWVVGRRLQRVSVGAGLPVCSVGAVLPVCSGGAWRSGRPRRTSRSGCACLARRPGSGRSRGAVLPRRSARPGCRCRSGPARRAALSRRTRRAGNRNGYLGPVRQVLHGTRRIRCCRRPAVRLDLRAQHPHVGGERRDGVTPPVRLSSDPLRLPRLGRGTPVGCVYTQPHQGHRAGQDQEDGGQGQGAPAAGENTRLTVLHGVPPSSTAILARSPSRSAVSAVICRSAAVLSVRSWARSA